jgi:hypothetical protein
MSEAGSVRRRRSRVEVEKLVGEYEASGLTRDVFSQQRGLLRLASWFGPFRHFVLAHPWAVEGLGNIHPVVVAAVGMWESLLSDFQGLWEGWENSFTVFPCFPADRHFHRLFRLRYSSVEIVLLVERLLLLVACSTEAVGLGTCFDDVRLIGKTVEHRLAEPCVGKHLRPLGEG